MNVHPVATYRVQFRDGMTFDRAAGLVPYLRRLGISHLYASPILTAITGSTHGYDVIDHNEIDPALGGRSGFDRLVLALSKAGMGLILDIVPNHMAASLENRWWRSVIEFGLESPFACHFDIDWRERLTLPILGQPFSETLAAGELTLEADRKNGCLCLTYFDHRLPLVPSSYAALGDRLGFTALKNIAGSWRGAAADRFHDDVRAFLAKNEVQHLDAALSQASQDTGFLERIHTMQPWELTFWKEARHHLTYRRFFEVTGLAGLRVEDKTVFDDVHRLTLELVNEGAVDGLRIDHIDGLARPGSYLRRLRQAVGPDCWLLVEKIRGNAELLPADWPDCGTTGYEFIPVMADLLVDAQGLKTLQMAHDRYTGSSVDIVAEERQAKLLMLRRNFEGELARLTELALPDDAAPPTRDELATAIAEIIAGFDVYRTYGEDGILSAIDMDRLRNAAVTARKRGVASARGIERVLSLLECSRPGIERTESAFRTRFQQLTGPIMAKAVEDTLFYRDNRLIALNEVGTTPAAAVGDVACFHDAMARFLGEPMGLAATATHDTKRGEDARARLYALSEAPERWSAAINRLFGEADLIEPSVAWMFGQMLFATWPYDGQPNEVVRAELPPRLMQAVKKSLREAKLRTDWLAPQEAYEARVLDVVRDLFAPDQEGVLRNFVASGATLVHAGELNSLSQTLTKLTGPAVPDIYQGTERVDLSLVDPDNRRPVDFEAYAHALACNEGAAPEDLRIADGSFKQWMIAKVLRFRAQHADLFRRGRHVPVPLKGAAAAHYVVWLREHETSSAMVVVPRLTLRLKEKGLTSSDAAISFAQPPRAFRNVLTGKLVGGGERERLSIAEVVDGLPVALCVAETAS